MTLGLYLFLINYITIKNKTALEQAWEPKHFFRMILIAGFLSTSSLLVCRVLLFTINNDEKTYQEYEFSSSSIVVMSLMLGLQQYAQRSVKATSQAAFKASPTTVARPIDLADPFSFQPQKAQLPIITEFDSGIPFISGNIIIPYHLLPQCYIFSTLFVRFIFERPFSMRFLFDFFWVWFYIRFFMKSTNSQGIQEIGDLSPEFQFCLYFP